MSRFKKDLPMFQAVATMVGTIIGAGILGIPFVFARAGFWTGVLMLGIITFAMVALKLMFGELTLRTYGQHQISGYVEKYMGNFWKNLTSLVLIISVAGSLLAYFVGVGQVLAEIFGSTQLMWGLGFYILASIFLFFGLKLIKKAEFILTLFIFLVILLIFILSHAHINFYNLNVLNLSQLFIPYGVVLFACSGIMAVPEVRQILFRREHLFKKSMYLGALIPAVVYFIFAFIVVGVSGSQTTEVATLGLGNIVGPHLLVIGNIFAFLTMSTSFLTLGLGLKDTLHFDLKIKHLWAWLISVLIPLIIYFAGLRDFINILALVGAFGFGINGVIYIFTYWLARKKGQRYPEYRLPKLFAAPVSIFLILIFIGGLIYTLFDVF